jgi:hypothetical protein
MRQWFAFCQDKGVAKAGMILMLLELCHENHQISCEVIKSILQGLPSKVT